MRTVAEETSRGWGGWVAERRGGKGKGNLRDGRLEGEGGKQGSKVKANNRTIHSQPTHSHMHTLMTQMDMQYN